MLQNYIKVKKETKWIYQKLLNFIKTEIIIVEWPKSKSNIIITLDMNTMINISFNKHPMLLEIINHCLPHQSDTFSKEMCLHHTFTVLLKQFPKKINEAPCIVCFTKNYIVPLEAQLLILLTFYLEQFYMWNSLSKIWLQYKASFTWSLHFLQKQEFSLYYLLHTINPQSE